MKTKSIIKTGIAVMFILLLTAPVFSQVRFGVKGSVGLNNPDFKTLDETFDIENMTSYSIGPSIEAMFLPLGVAEFGIDAALLYNDNRMTITPPPGGEAAASTEVANRYLNLPVNAKLKFGLGMLPLRLFATAGPWAGYLIDGDEFSITDITNDIKAKEFQAGANLGFGIEVLRFLQVGLNYSVKLTDDYSINEPNWKEPLNGKNESWTVTGIIFF
ncbi:MAG: outer membrane beta-barrel protein [Fermentimonas sp.]|nr:outer membrane beta-barrel protein [Fermentimonas sp.]